MDEYKKYEPIFGSWYLKRLIGKGSFGKVFEITREEYGTAYRAALKIITVPQDEDDVKTRMTEGTDLETISEYYESVLKEIINENEIMSRLKGNSNIVSYEDHQIIPHDDGIGYDVLIRMELLTPLLDRMVEKRLEEKEVVKLGIDICKALEVCHRKNIIHRDIKPQNIFISENGDYKLGDFGIARTMEKTTGGMSKKGTYKYMAPEVFRGEDYDSTVDIYSLGIVLYTLLNGNRGPFLPMPPAKVTYNDEEEARMRRFRGEEIPAPRDAGSMLAYIIKKACAADPSNRYRTAEQMRRDLESYLANYNSQSAMSAAGFAGEETMAEGSVRAQTADAAGMQPRDVQPRSIPQDKKRGKIWIPIVAVLGVIILAAGAFFIIRGAKSEETALIRMSTETEGVAVLSSDWDWDYWDSHKKDSSSELYRVDDILWVINDSAYPIVGIVISDMTFENGEQIGIGGDAGEAFTAYGYIPAGETGVMHAEVFVEEELTVDRPKALNDSYQISSVIINETMGDYVVPYGSVTDFTKAGDYYDIEMTNSNDTDVSKDAVIVAYEFKDGKIFDADATGKLDSDIPAGTSGFYQKAAFVDPNFYADPKYQNKTVCAIDKGKYGLDELPAE